MRTEYTGRKDHQGWQKRETDFLRLSDQEFATICRLAKERFGIHLGERKRLLINGRIQKLLRKLRLATVGDFLHFLHRDDTGRALSSLIDHISTNHTHFFREFAQLEFFRDKALPEVIERLRRTGSHDIRIWCAGCSSGEEAYSLLMFMKECFGKEYLLWDAGLLATDISQRVLDQAVAGCYDKKALIHVPPLLRQKYFLLEGTDRCRVVPDVRREVTFRRFNLKNERFPFKRPFDIIFCRNVMIYFDQLERNALIRKFHANLVEGGFLFIGASESLQKQETSFVNVAPSVFRKGMGV